MYRIVCSGLQANSSRDEALRILFSGSPSCFTQYLRGATTSVTASSRTLNYLEFTTLPNSSTYANSCDMLLLPKNVGEYRPFIMKRNHYNTRTSVEFRIEYVSGWILDDTNDIDSFLVFSGGYNVSGNIKIYEIDLP
jgi:hypothetical protein